MERALHVRLCFASDFPQGPSRQKKYQIHLKSTSGPIDVLLVNKDAWSSPPVVLPVPPPEDLIQCQAVAPSKPQIPPLAHFQEASVPSSTQPSTPTPSSTQDHSPPEQKDTSTGERDVAESRNGVVAVQQGNVHLGTRRCQLLAKGTPVCLLHQTSAFILVGLGCADGNPVCVCGSFQNAASQWWSPRAAVTSTPSAMCLHPAARQPGWTHSCCSPLPLWTAALSYPAPLPPLSQSNLILQEVSMHLVCLPLLVPLGARGWLLAPGNRAELCSASAVSQIHQE